MVEYTLNLDSVFGSLSDPTRRDILKRLTGRELSVGELAQPYENLTLAAVSKHLKVLEKAKLIIKRRQGKKQIVKLAPQTLTEAVDFLETYRQMREDRLGSLEEYLSKERSNNV
jgi:DNA-binding transcriptional ArsR family regulator